MANGNGKHLKRVRIDDLLTFSPITKNQEKTFKSFKGGQNLILHGIAGTGKTFMSLYLALEEVLDKSSLVNDIFIVRSVVSTRDIGFLPGDEQEKVSIYEAPYRSICGEFFNVRDAYDSLKSQGTIKFMSTSFIRGITINDSIVIVDECQNLNFHELDSIITRVGRNSRIIFCGDYTQTDLTKENDKKGILRFMEIIKHIKEFETIEFDIDDIERRMVGALSVLKGDLSTLRTGRASTTMLDSVTVDVYGSTMPLSQCATVTVPEARLITVNVWDKSNVQAEGLVTCHQNCAVVINRQDQASANCGLVKHCVMSCRKF